MQQLGNSFNQDFSNSLRNVFTDPQQQQRYNQLYLQYQGYGAFNNPIVAQHLNLTDQQRQQLNQLGQQWSQQWSDLSRLYNSDRNAFNNQWRDWRVQFNQNLNNILNNDQQTTWRNMIGQPYDFSPEIYFQGSASGATTLQTP